MLGKKSRLLKLSGTVFLCAVMAVATAYLLNKGLSSRWYANLYLPRNTPKKMMFMFLWIISYGFLGATLYLINEEKKHLLHDLAEAMLLILLLVSFLWPPCFFYFQAPKIGLSVLALLILAIFIAGAVFYKIASGSAALMVAYMGWVTFLFYLNAFVVAKN